MNEYRILKDQLPEGLASVVSKHMTRGWQVHGAPLSYGCHLVQAVTRSESSFGAFAMQVADGIKEALRCKGFLPLRPGTTFDHLKRLIAEADPQAVIACDEDKDRVMKLMAERLSIAR